MSAEDVLNDELMVLEEETMKVAEQVQAYQRKLMTPIWEKRREMVKKIPGFWGQVLGNSPLFGVDPSENDVEALENLVDFHVEYDHEKPDYRKVSATFKKNDIFKNETLTKEYSIDPESDGSVISKTTIEYHESKAPNKKRKAADEDDDDDDFAVSFLEWFSDDDVRPGIILSEDIFPNAIEYFQGPEDDDEDEDEEIELGSEDESEEEEEKPKKKKSKK
ncbi:uncharacterized protein BX663DRAFT_506099 [Cokeromyces recurvatus]|uniref:uncharacterized protein n=1 Tax=Cokeromyces recurvatus TaxID=90255 RepID=UPI0022207FF2|nr:uncharacterized protein BX663DRAFT_506099 [Cokeromyces recurvatus]KAI7904008.1 hypothetical protein BX663DRAFT_506099 [Cokeromyces recurvatus]